MSVQLIPIGFVSNSGETATGGVHSRIVRLNVVNAGPLHKELNSPNISLLNINPENDTNTETSLDVNSILLMSVRGSSFSCISRTHQHESWLTWLWLTHSLVLSLALVKALS